MENISLNEEQIETEIQEKDLNAPRLTPEMLDEVIIDAQYHVFPGTTVTVCCLQLKNGFNTIGESAAVSMDNFDESIGRSIAYSNARDKIWTLEGYLLKQQLFEQNKD